MFSDNELIVKAEGRIEVLDRQCVNGKNDPILDGIQTSLVALQLLSLTFINVLTAKSSYTNNTNIIKIHNNSFKALTNGLPPFAISNVGKNL